jgi:hypothetical protein
VRTEPRLLGKIRVRLHLDFLPFGTGGYWRKLTVSRRQCAKNLFACGNKTASGRAAASAVAVAAAMTRGAPWAASLMGEAARLKYAGPIFFDEILARR